MRKFMAVAVLTLAACGGGTASSGCASQEARDQVTKMRAQHKVYRTLSQPAEGQDKAKWEKAGEGIDANYAKLEELLK